MNPLTRRNFLECTAAAAGAWQSAGKTILEQARAGERLTGVDVVDMHGHFLETEPGRIWPRSLAPLLRDMDRCGVGQIVVSHFAAIAAVTPGELRGAHDESAARVREHGKRLRAYLVFHPYLLDASQAEMKRALEAGSPFAGFKLHGALHKYTFDGPNYRPLFEFANEHGLPVLYHYAGEVERSAVICKRYPRMNLILAHLGGGGEAVIPFLKSVPNLYVDTCSSTLQHRWIEYLVSQVGPEKILFGTDATYLSIGPQVARVAFANIPEDSKRLIFGGNARRIFGRRLAPA